MQQVPSGPLINKQLVQHRFIPESRHIHVRHDRRDQQLPNRLATDENENLPIRTRRWDRRGEQQRQIEEVTDSPLGLSDKCLEVHFSAIASEAQDGR
jgi:hypothetical protein